MKTVKQVSDLTGISVRTLHYYDEIGLLKPSKITAAGYRLYNDEALETLQQILFFKELDIPLKEVKNMITSAGYDKVQALKKQQKLLILKRNRLNGLITLIDQTIKGENTMSFKEFDMSEYINALEEFKREHEEEIIKYYGSIEKYNELIETCKTNEADIAKMAIKQFGSIEKYTEAMKKNLGNFSNIMKQYDKMKNDNLQDSINQLNRIQEQLTSDLTREPASAEVQQIIEELAAMTKKQHEALHMDMGENYWGLMAELYLTKPQYNEVTDRKYGSGAAKFIGEAFQYYSEHLPKEE